MGWRDLNGQVKAAAIIAILGFVIRVTSTSQSSINGVVTCWHNDFAALGLGILAVILGGLGALRAQGHARNANMIVGGIAAAVGVVHVLRGFGMVGGPCG